MSCRLTMHCHSLYCNPCFLSPHSYFFFPPFHKGLPLNIAALLPMMMVHFDEPDDFCVTCAQTLSKVKCTVGMLHTRTHTHTHTHAHTHTHTLHLSSPAIALPSPSIPHSSPKTPPLPTPHRCAPSPLVRT